jgi:alpha-ketoglutarate-dependent taurine dioxygenase
MTLRITDLEPRIGSLVESDLETLLSGDVAGRLRELLEQRGVLVFRGAPMEDPQQLAFTRTFGDIYGPDVGDIYKVTFDQRENPTHYRYNRGNFSWHIDRTDTDLPPFASILNVKRLAPWGGETEFANTYAAYEDMPDVDKALIEDLKVVHRVEASYREAVPDPSEEDLATWRGHPDKVHPLVWRHRSGRKSLITSMSGESIVGMDREQGAALLARLLAWATQPQYVYRHEWRLGDIVMWDNTGLMHRARPYDTEAGRLMHRTTVAGDEPFDPHKQLHELQA